QDERRDPLGVLCRVGHGHRRALRETDHGRAAHAGRVDDGAELGDEVGEANRRRLALRKAGAARIVADEAMVADQALEPVLPDRTIPVELEVIEPVGRLDERWRVAETRIGEASAVAGRAELRALRAPRRVSFDETPVGHAHVRVQAIALAAYGLDLHTRRATE